MKTVLMVLYIPTFLFAANEVIKDSGTESNFQYAVKLYLQNDYYRSITEFKRFLFFSSNKEKKDNADLYIGLNYLKGKDFDNAKRKFYTIYNQKFHFQRTVALLHLADTYLNEQKGRIKQHNYFTPLFFFPEYYINYLSEYKIEDEKYYNAYTKLILVHMLNFNKERALYLINNSLITNKHYETVRMELASRLKEMKNVPQKSKITATFLSVLIPGMGQIYTGEIKEGLIALSVNIGMGFAAYYSFTHYSKLLGILIGQYELTYYFGNILNAQSAVEKYNENKKNLYRQKLFQINF